MPPTAGVIINLRARELQRDLIDRAAQTQGRNRSEFMLDAACDKARQVLLEQSFFALNKESYLRFVELLDAPPRVNAGLKRLLAVKSPWER
jgi:uncharacterized protein (DUF1778 family)